MPMDIVRWASDGTLPYLRLPSLATQLLDSAHDAGCDLPLILLRLRGMEYLMCHKDTYTLWQGEEYLQGTSTSGVSLAGWMCTGVLGTQDLVILSAEVAADLGMQLPPANAGSLLLRYIRDLELPEASRPSHD